MVYLSLRETADIVYNGLYYDIGLQDTISAIIILWRYERMRKRSLAALLAFSLIFSTVLPAAATDTAESTGNVTAEEQELQVSDQTAGTEAAVAEAPTEYAADDSMIAETGSDLADDMIVDEEFSEETFAEDQTAADIAVEPQLVIEDSEVVDAPAMAANTSDILEVKFQEKEKKSQINCLEFIDYVENLTLSVKYQDGTSGTASCDAGAGIGGSDVQYTFYTDRDDVVTVYFMRPNDVDTDDVMAKYVRPGTYQVKILQDRVYDEEGRHDSLYDSWTVEVCGGLPDGVIPADDNGCASGTGIDHWESKYFTFVPKETEQYDVIASYPIYYMWYLFENDQITVVFNSGSEVGGNLKTPALEAGKTYILRTISGTANDDIWNIRIDVKDEIESMEIVAEKVYDAASAGHALENIEVKVTYKRAGIKTASDWQGTLGDNGYYERKLDNGDKVYVWFYDKDGNAIAPIFNYEDIPFGDFNIKAGLNWIDDEEGNQKQIFDEQAFSIEDPRKSGVPEIKLGDAPEYTLEKEKSVGYLFKPENEGEYTIKISDRDLDISVYEIQESYMSFVGDSDLDMDRLAFSAQKGSSYLIAVYSPYYNSDPVDANITITDNVGDDSDEDDPSEEDPGEENPGEEDPGEEDESPCANGHTWDNGTVTTPATVFADAVKTFNCRYCDETKQEAVPGTRLKATVTLTATSLTMKKKQSTKKLVASGFALGDSLASAVSSNTKVVKVTAVNARTGEIGLKAQNKTGKASLTIKLASGHTVTVGVKVQSAAVKTTKISGVPKKLTLKAKKSYTLKPVLKPITTQDKLKFTTSNKKVATVSKKGVIKAKKKGSATITVTCGKKKVKCKVKVTN